MTGSGGRTGFSFRSRWELAAPLDQVAVVLLDLAGYPDWWPQVLAVASLGPDKARVLCRSRLPYTLDLVLTAVHREPPVLQTAISGDLRGVVRWRVSPSAVGTRLDFEQDVEVTTRWVRMGARLAAPLLRWNHEQMMIGCRQGLGARLQG